MAPFPEVIQILQILQCEALDSNIEEEVSTLFKRFLEEGLGFEKINRKMIEKALRCPALKDALLVLAYYFIIIFELDKLSDIQAPSQEAIFIHFGMQLLNGCPFEGTRNLKVTSIQYAFCKKYYNFFITNTIFIPKFQLQNSTLKKSGSSYMLTLIKLCKQSTVITRMDSYKLKGPVAYALLKEGWEENYPSSIFFEDIENFAQFCLQQREKDLSQYWLLHLKLPCCSSENRIKKIAEKDFTQFAKIILQYGVLLEEAAEKRIAEIKKRINNNEKDAPEEDYSVINFHDYFIHHTQNMFCYISDIVDIYWKKLDYANFTYAYECKESPFD